MRVTLDSNVLVYAADDSAGEKHHLSSQLISRAAHADCLLTVQSLAEFFYAATRKAKVGADAATEFADTWATVFRVVNANVDTVFMAIDAAKGHKIGFFDAMLWATARQAGCRLLLSEDFQDGRALDGVLFLNPFLAKNAAFINAALGPTRQRP